MFDLESDRLKLRNVLDDCSTGLLAIKNPLQSALLSKAIVANETQLEFGLIDSCHNLKSSSSVNTVDTAFFTPPITILDLLREASEENSQLPTFCLEDFLNFCNDLTYMRKHRCSVTPDKVNQKSVGDSVSGVSEATVTINVPKTSSGDENGRLRDSSLPVIFPSQSNSNLQSDRKQASALNVFSKPSVEFNSNNNIYNNSNCNKSKYSNSTGSASFHGAGVTVHKRTHSFDNEELDRCIEPVGSYSSSHVVQKAAVGKERVNPFKTARTQFVSEGGVLPPKQPAQTGKSSVISSLSKSVFGGSSSGSSAGKVKTGELVEELAHLDKALVEKIESDIIHKGQPVVFNDIAGLEFAKKCVQELIVWPMSRPGLFLINPNPP